MAARDGLITVLRRPRPGRKNLTNVIRVISAEWSAWLKHRSHRPSSPKVQGEKIYTPRSQNLERGLARKGRAGQMAHGMVETRHRRRMEIKKNPPA